MLPVFQFFPEKSNPYQLLTKALEEQAQHKKEMTQLEQAIAQRVHETSDVNTIQSPKSGETLLHFAAERGFLEVIDLLIEKGVDIDNQNNPVSVTPLQCAVKNFQFDVVKKLIDAGADKELENWLGDTPLNLAVMHSLEDDKKNSSVLESRLKIIKYLVDSGVNPNGERTSGKNDSLLHLAVAGNVNVNIIESLLKAGADIHLKNNEGNTPLHLAVKENAHVNIIKSLLKAGADIYLKNNEDQSSFDLRYPHSPRVIKSERIRNFVDTKQLLEQKNASLLRKDALKKSEPVSMRGPL